MIAELPTFEVADSQSLERLQGGEPLMIASGGELIRGEPSPIRSYCIRQGFGVPVQDKEQSTHEGCSVLCGAR